MLDIDAADVVPVDVRVQPQQGETEVLAEQGVAVKPDLRTSAVKIAGPVSDVVRG